MIEIPIYVLFLLSLTILPLFSTDIIVQSNGTIDSSVTTGADLYTTSTFNNLKRWIVKHRSNGGIIISTGKRTIYPEVTGYYIPTLLSIGEYQLAEEFGLALVLAQHKDGGFGLGGSGFVFDTAMVVRGLNELVIRQPKRKEFVQTLNAACLWLTKEIDSTTNRWVVPEGNIWGLPSGRGRVSEGIHLLGILPLRKCGHILNNKKYIRTSEEMEKRLISDLGSHELKDFTKRHHLSHFFAYIMEALQELGHTHLVNDGMALVASFQRDDGAVSAYWDVEWVCTTGLAQFALVWYRMGDPDSIARADHAMIYLFNQLQNKKTYGFTGSVGQEATYFPFQEISWAVKYAIDALLAVPVAHFNHVVVDTFPTHVSPKDDRLIAITEIVDTLLEKQRESEKDQDKEAEEPKGLNVLDIGCGKGRFANALKRLYSTSLRVTGTDISPTMLRMAFKHSNRMNHFVESSSTSLPFQSDTFDIIYLIESMEHILFVNATLKECYRVLRKNGVLLVVDKTIDDEFERNKLWELEKWENWFGIQEMQNNLIPIFGNEQVTSKRLDMDDGLFVAWQGRKI